MITTEERIRKMLKLRIMRKLSTKPWAEIHGLTKEKDNAKKNTSNGTSGSDQPSSEYVNTQQRSHRTGETGTIRPSGSSRRMQMLKETTKGLSVFIAGIMVFIGTLLAIYGIVVAFHMHLHDKLI